MSDTQRPEEFPTAAGLTSAGGDANPVAAQMSIGKVGRYKITRLIGEGGMGAVYEAEQDQPRRTVALKVIKPGLASPELLRRFAQESQALGRLQHPGIAQIYDAGTADTGYGPQPYFAMEYIRGEGLRDYAESHHLNTRQRLEIVVKVCDAVHHAHQRGLIHRDLKPGNIIVDETGQPKILDFGVAHVTDSDSQATMQTDVGQLVGTLAYMSPEQVLADPLELDIRSDVYALGVILYELLAGRLPYNISKKLHEALHAIREEDPSKLSSINRTYRGDIETIAAKALEKDKTRRYSSAAELAADITHYLKDEPIVAQPPSTSYQLRKFARRHKALVGAVAVVFVVLVAGVVVSSWLAVRAIRAEATAVQDSKRATAAEKVATTEKDKAVKAEGQAIESEGKAKLDRDKAVAEKKRADIESATAKAVSAFLQKNLFEQVTGGQRGASLDLSVSGALDRAAAKIDGTFDKQPLVEAGVREAVANAYLSLALFDKAATQVDRALALRRRVQDEADADVLNAMSVLSAIYTYQRKFGDAEALLSHLVELKRRSLGREHPDTLKSALDLAAIYLVDRKGDKAEPLAVEVVNVRRRTLGPNSRDTLNATIALESIYQMQLKLPQALTLAAPTYESARRALGENDSTTLAAKTLLQTLNMLANPGASSTKGLSEAVGNANRSLESRPVTSLPEMISAARARANRAVREGHPEEGEPPLLDALDAARRAGVEDLNLMADLMDVYARQKKYADAEAALLNIAASSAVSTGTNRTALPAAMRDLAVTYRSHEKFAEAEPHLLKLVALVRVTPGESVQATRVDMGTLAENYSNQRKYPQTEEALNQLLAAQRQFTGPEAANTLVTVANIGWARLQQKRYPEAEKTFREAAAILTRTTPNAWERFNVDSMLGATLAAQKKFAEAEPLLISGYEGMGPSRKLSTATTTSRFTQDQAGQAILQLYADWGKPDKRAEWTAKIQTTKNAVAERP